MCDVLTDRGGVLHINLAYSSSVPLDDTPDLAPEFRPVVFDIWGDRHLLGVDWKLLYTDYRDSGLSDTAPASLAPRNRL